MEKYLDKIILYPFGIGVVLLFIGSIFDVRILQLVGILGFLPLAVVLFFGVVGLFWELMDNLIPDFKAKSYVVGVIVLVFTVLFAVSIHNGAGGESGACQTYRGIPTC